MTWLPGVERIPSDRANGGTYVDAPWRFVAHTTEAVPSSIDGARAMAARHPTPPHLWCWPERDWVGQTVRLDRSAFALLHPAGTPHTNKARAIQVELIGRAADSPAKPASWWEWIGRRVLRPIIAAGYTINLGHVARTTGSDGYGTSGAVRMSWDAWRSFDGVCGHANVPGNSHWDPGAGRLDLVAAAAAATGDDDMTPEQERKLDEALGLLRSLVPNTPRKVLTTGSSVGTVSEEGKPAAEIWRWGLETLFRTRALDPASLAQQIAERLPSSAGPVKITDLEQALRTVLGSLDA